MENGASFNDALKAGARSGAIAYFSASMAYEIKMSGISGFQKGLAHGVRGALTAAASGGDARSGFAGGFIWKWFHNHSEVGGMQNNRFTPQNKPVEKLIKEHYQQYSN